MNDAYPLRPFRINDRGLLQKVMRQWPLATLISGEIGSAYISLIPLLVKDDPSGDLRLYGHLDINNEHANAIEAGAPISFQFTGPLCQPAATGLALRFRQRRRNNRIDYANSSIEKLTA